MLNKNSIAGAVLLVFCAVVYWLTTFFNAPPSMLSQNVPPTFFPRLVLGVIALLSMFVFASGLAGTPDSRDKPISKQVLLTGVVIVSAGLAVSLIGTLPTLAAVAVVLPLCWGERRWRYIVPVAIGLPIFIYMIFAVLLDVRFPGGLLAPSGI